MEIGQVILAIVLGCIGSTALFGFIQFLITRKDNKTDKLEELGTKMDTMDQKITAQITKIGNDTEAKFTKLNDDLTIKFNEINNKLNDLELGSCRAQLLALIDNHPLNAADIYKLAEYYFVTLHGDAFMSEIFKGWVKSRGEKLPGWFLVLYPDASGGQDNE